MNDVMAIVLVSFGTDDQLFFINCERSRIKLLKLYFMNGIDRRDITGIVGFSMTCR